MEQLDRLEAVAVPIATVNCDTDQILPAQFLQKLRSDDFGRYLFHDFRFGKDGSEVEDFILNQAAVPAGAHPRRQSEFRLRLLARARGLGALRLRIPCRHRPELRRHLPGEQPEERAAAYRPAAGGRLGRDRAARSQPRRNDLRRSRRAEGPAVRRLDPRVRGRSVREALPHEGRRRARLHARTPCRHRRFRAPPRRSCGVTHCQLTPCLKEKSP